MKQHRVFRAARWLAALAIGGGMAGAVQADTVVLGTSGWQASWDSSLDGLVDIVLDGITSDSVIIQKAVEFTQPPGVGGLFPPVAVVFQQISANAVPNIIITDEILTNSTGTAWTDFHMQLVDSGDAVFNPAATTGSGFSTAPFGHLTFGSGNTTLDVDGFGLGPGGSNATVPHGGIYSPGAAAGELYIVTNPHSSAPFTTFSLKESPTPEPATGLVLLLGATLLRRR